MSKNIILCADGTGNKGGYTPDSNVYKLYNGVDIHNAQQQVTYYDNGVGTSQNKFKKAISGALGLGFARNVRDLYEFLSINYVPGDKVYLFGFSRGAATIRAFMGFISVCGLVKGHDLPNDKLKRYTKDAFKAYRKSKSQPTIAKAFHEHKNSHGIIDIEMVGVWDTVSALGLPEHTDKLGLLSSLMSIFFKVTDNILNLFWPHHFYQYHLTENVKYACQALAMDDARTSFWPMVWDEKGRATESVEQVWFAGMHSNVGGGYERQGLANVALHWMLIRTQQKGLIFKPGFVEQQWQDSNVNGRLYDSRDGMGILYRYHPRQVKNLCQDKLNEHIKIHYTVFERMKALTANYAPTHIPEKFQVAYTEPGRVGEIYDIPASQEWSDGEAEIKKNVEIRKVNYMLMITILLYVAYLFISSWCKGDNYFESSGMVAQASELLSFIIPKAVEGFIEVTILRYPVLFAAFVIFIYAFWKFNKFIIKRIHNGAIKIRNIINQVVSI